VRAFAETSGGKAKVVWMPTHDSEHEVRYLKQARPFVRVSHEGVLLPQVLEVLDLIAHYDLTLATGHVTPREMLQIIEEAKKRGVDRIIVTHPGLAPQFSDPTVEDVQRAVAQGAYAEIVASELFRAGSRDDAIALIRTLGPEHCILSTDSGIVGTPNHTDALALAAQILREAGFGENDLALMAKINPARVLGLGPS
jgi:predicted TIM-barrel fold metal-dependent hydrolase